MAGNRAAAGEVEGCRAAASRRGPLGLAVTASALVGKRTMTAREPPGEALGAGVAVAAARQRPSWATDLAAVGEEVMTRHQNSAYPGGGGGGDGAEGAGSLNGSPASAAAAAALLYASTSPTYAAC